jgi:hypothetical protein
MDIGITVVPPGGSSPVDGINAWFVSEVTPLLWVVRGWYDMPVVSRAHFYLLLVLIYFWNSELLSRLFVPPRALCVSV